MACERPLRIPNPRYACCIGAVNFDQSKAYDGVTIQDYCEIYFGYRGRPPDEYIDVPCGKCFSCNRSRLNGWRIRLLSEVNRYPNSIFVTLTFNDKYLSKFKDNPNKAISLFLDRTRKKYGKQIRHFFIAEFGTLNGRIHYHGIIFNAPYKSLDPTELATEWKYGVVYLGWCNEKTCNYIVKYITKDAPKGQKVPRVIASKGLGESYVKEYGLSHRMSAMPYIRKGTYRIPLPRYYLTKLWSDYERVQLQIKSMLEPYVRYVDGYKYTDELSYKDALHKYSLKQISLGLSPKPEVYKPSILTTLEWSRALKYLTPWDDDDESFTVFPHYGYYLINLHDNVYQSCETPF